MTDASAQQRQRPRPPSPRRSPSPWQRDGGPDMTMLSRDQLAQLPQVFAADVAAGLDVTTPAGREAARLRVACRLAKNLRATTLVKACRVCGLRVPQTGPAAAHALAALAIPDTPA